MIDINKLNHWLNVRKCTIENLNKNLSGKINQKISLNKDDNQNIDEDTLAQESQDTNTNTSENVTENKSNPSKNVEVLTQENIENENIQKEVGKADEKEVEQNNQLTSDPKQTEKS